MLNREKNFVLDMLDQFEVFFLILVFISATRGMGKQVLSWGKL